MKVYELLAELQAADPEANVIIYLGGEDEPTPDVWFDVTGTDDGEDNFVIEVD